jgi:hypothetical protein
LIGDYLFHLRAYAMEVFDDLYVDEPTPPCEDMIQWWVSLTA